MSLFTTIRQQESELPYVVNIQFINMNADYQQGSQQSMRMAVRAKQKVNLNTAVVFEDLEARNIAERMMYNVWVERDRFHFMAPRQFAYLEATDVLTLRDMKSGVDYMVRIIKITESRNGNLEIEATTDSPSIYKSNSTTTPATVVPQTFPVSSATKWVMFELPALRGIDVSAGFYVAMAGETATWAGGTIQQSLDGQNYVPYITSSTPSVIGEALNALGSPPAVGVDNTNTLTVKLWGSKGLQTINQAAFDGGANLAAVESSYGWELINFKNATLVGENTYEISVINRGREFTKVSGYKHAIGNRFVLIDTTSIVRASLPDPNLLISVSYKILTTGQRLGDGIDQSFVCRGESMMQYSEALVHRVESSSNDLEIFCNGASGTYTYMMTPSFEDCSHDVEIWDSTFTTLKRTFSDLKGNIPGEFYPGVFKFSYGASERTADYGSPTGNVHMKIYTVHPTLGRNRSYNISLDVDAWVANGGTDGPNGIVGAG